MTAKESQQEESYYVGIEGAVPLRRQILETAKGVVHTVGAHKKLQDIQEEKLRLRTELVRVTHDLRKHLHDLQEKLPVKDLPSAKQPIHGHGTRKKQSSDHKLDKIEAALAEIESRMRSM